MGLPHGAPARRVVEILIKLSEMTASPHVLVVILKHLLLLLLLLVKNTWIYLHSRKLIVVSLGHPEVLTNRTSHGASPYRISFFS